MKPIALLLAAALCAFAFPLHAQSGPEWNPQGLKMERSELENLRDQFERVVASPGYSQRIRDQAARDAAIIRDRLVMGDFRIGDRVILRVEGEPDIPERLPVQPGPRITLPRMGSISLEGVLRSELEEYLTDQLGRFLQNPVVQAGSEIRISIMGSVGSPGFYTVPSEMLIGELLMHAGGPGGNADLEKLRIERLGESLWSGDEMQEFIVEGVTLDQLNLRAGDQVVLPEQTGPSIWGRVARWGLATAATVFLGVRVAQF